MFKMKFFILFLLAVLCFGNTSASETDSGNGEGEGTAPVAGEASPSVGGDSDGEKKEESTDADPGNGASSGAKEKSNTFKKAAGLPPWIVDPTTFLDTLIKRCHDSFTYFGRQLKQLKQLN
uniref:Putative secreted protein n=1 Tax=Ixodes ricinus TaxID=34613 RepID=V5ICW0_IXORI